MTDKEVADSAMSVYKKGYHACKDQNCIVESFKLIQSTRHSQDELDFIKFDFWLVNPCFGCVLSIYYVLLRTKSLVIVNS